MNLPTHIRWLFTAGLLLVATATRAASLPATAAIRFEGSSTLHDFHGEVASHAFDLELAPAAGDQVASWSARAEVRVGEMTTAHAKRDRKMWAMFDEPHWPRILARVDRAPIPAGGESVTVDATLTISGITKTVPVTISNWQDGPDGVTFVANWTVSLKEFGLRAPSVLGLIRVADTVKLKSQVTASRAAVGAGLTAAN